MFKYKSNRAQILVVTLIVMFIISLIALSASISVSRDTQERVYNETYEQNYYTAQSRILQASEITKTIDLTNPGNISTNLQTSFKKIDNLAGSFTSSCSLTGTDNYTCKVVEDCNTADLTFSFKNTIENLELPNNDAIQINLISGASYYNGPISVTWTGNVVWSISLIYQRNYYNEFSSITEATYDIVKDVYDGINAIPETSNVFTFSSKSSNAFTISGLSNLQINDSKVKSNFVKNVALRLKPIITNNATSTLVNLAGTSALPYQFVELNSQSKNTCLSNTSPTPLLSLKLPINSAPSSIFDYVYFEN